MKNLKVALVAACAVVVGASADIPASAYVQDGLIAQWDGIDNAGMGTHDANATTWKNLKQGSIDFTLPSGCTVGADSVTIPAKTKLTMSRSRRQRLHQLRHLPRRCADLGTGRQLVDGQRRRWRRWAHLHRLRHRGAGGGQSEADADPAGRLLPQGLRRHHPVR